MKKKIDNIGIVFIPDFLFLQLNMCKKIFEDYNCNLHGYTGSVDSIKFINNNFDASFFKTLSSSAHPQRNAHKLKIKNIANVWSTAKKYEKILGKPYGEIILANRHFGKGFALAGTHHPESPQSKINYTQMTEIINRELIFWDKELKEKKIKLFINPTKALAMLAHKRNVKVRIQGNSRHKNFFFWSEDEFCLNKTLKNQFSKIKKIEKNTYLKVSYHLDFVQRKDFFKDSALYKVIKECLKIILYRIKGTLKGYDGIKDSYYLGSFIKYRFKGFRDRNLMMSNFTKSISQLEKKPFFFFPLATEPEWSLQVQASDFFSQLWAIAMIARDLPSGTTLAVKEHIYSLGSRPKDFYNQVKLFKNIEFIKINEIGINLIKKSIGVITINGAAGFEAAVLGKPVIVLSDNCDYDFLDHVQKIKNGEGLKKAIKLIEDNRIDLKKAKKDGRKFLQAVKNSSFNLDNFSNLKRTEVSSKAIVEMTNSLMRSV